MPCNTPECEHGTLQAVLPKEKSVVVLDSMPSSHIKYVSLDGISKMCGLLKEINSSIDLNQWKLIVNKKGDAPKQTNDYVCGVFTCLFERCLGGYGEMISNASISDFMKLMLLELHQRKLHPIPPEDILPEQYYAFEYVENYYIGRALSQAESFVRFKFLHRVGAKSFHWPSRDDVDDVHISCVYYGPVTLESAGPFAVPKQQNIEKMFKEI